MVYEYYEVSRLSKGHFLYIIDTIIKSSRPKESKVGNGKILDDHWRKIEAFFKLFILNWIANLVVLNQAIA